MIDIAASDRDMVKALIGAVCPQAKIFVFGSRADGTSKKTSDLDIVLRSDNKLDMSEVLDIKELMKASRLPFSVDVMDWNSLSEGFRKEIEDDLVEL